MTHLVYITSDSLVTFNSEQADPLYPSSTELPVLIDKYDGQVIEDADEYIYWSN